MMNKPLKKLFNIIQPTLTKYLLPRNKHKLISSKGININVVKEVHLKSKKVFHHVSQASFHKKNKLMEDVNGIKTEFNTKVTEIKGDAKKIQDKLEDILSNLKIDPSWSGVIKGTLNDVVHLLSVVSDLDKKQDKVSEHMNNPSQQSQIKEILGGAKSVILRAIHKQLTGEKENSEIKKGMVQGMDDALKGNVSEGINDLSVIDELGESMKKKQSEWVKIKMREVIGDMIQEEEQMESTQLEKGILLIEKDGVLCIRDVPYYDHNMSSTDSLFTNADAIKHSYKHKLNIYLPNTLFKVEETNSSNVGSDNTNQKSGNNNDKGFANFDLTLQHLISNKELKTEDLKGGLPIVIMVHSGGWSRGDRNHNFYGAPFQGKSLAKNGVIGITVSYRLSSNNENLFPCYVEDVSRAIKWVYNHAHLFGGDKDKIFLSGHSAGSHITSLITLNEIYLESVKLQQNLIKGVVGISGIFNLFNPIGEDGPSWKDLLFQRIYAIPAFGKNCEVWYQASPIFYVSKNKKAIPPFLLFSAKSDMGLESGVASFHNELKKAGCEVEYHVIDGTTHGSIIHNDKVVSMSVDFVKKVLAKKESVL